MGEVGPARRPRKDTAAWGLTILTLAVLAAALVFTALNAGRTSTARVGPDAFLSAGVMYAASGHLIASRRPDNAIGWLLSSIGLALAASMFAEQYAVYGLKTAPGAVPVPKVVGCGAATAALFGPLRSRVQRRVDHRFNRARYDAERMLAAFAARLKEELDADAVHDDLASTVHAALEPAHVSIWLAERP
jgi:hypothetical protein